MRQASNTGESLFNFSYAIIEREREIVSRDISETRNHKLSWIIQLRRPITIFFFLVFLSKLTYNNLTSWNIRAT